MLDIERWVKWVEKVGFGMAGYSGTCDICRKADRVNSWMVEREATRGLKPTVCEEHAREYSLMW